MKNDIEIYNSMKEPTTIVELCHTGGNFYSGGDKKVCILSWGHKKVDCPYVEKQLDIFNPISKCESKYHEEVYSVPIRG